MDNASLKMISIGKIIAIIMIALFTVFAVSCAFILPAGDSFDSYFYFYEMTHVDIYGVSSLYSNPLFILGYSLFVIAGSIVLLILSERARTAVEFSNTSGIGYLIAMMILGAYYSIFYFLGGLFGLIYLGGLKKLGL